MTTSFIYSAKYTEPDSEIANVFEICYAPRSTRRTNGPIYAMDFYTNKVVMFPGSSQATNATIHFKKDECNDEIDIKMEEGFEEIQIDYTEVKKNRMEMFMKHVVKTSPDMYKKMLEDAEMDANFHNEQYMPALENYARFVEDPEGSGIEDLTKGQYEDHQQEDGTIVSFPLDPHPVIFPFHIQNREKERLQQQDEEQRSFDAEAASRQAKQQFCNAYIADRRRKTLEIQRETARILEEVRRRNAQT